MSKLQDLGAMCNLRQLLQADASWKDIALHHVFADLQAPDGRGLDTDQAPELLDELLRLDDKDIELLFESDTWDWCLQERYEDMSPVKAVETAINMLHMMESNSRHLLSIQASKGQSPAAQPIQKIAPTADLWSRNDIQFSRLLSEIVATQDKLNMSALAKSMDLDVSEVDELFERAQTAWQTHLGQLQDGNVAGSGKFNAWCRQADGFGTTWVSEVTASSREEAITEARQACMSDWGLRGSILVIGVQSVADGELIWNDEGLDTERDDCDDEAQDEKAQP